MNGLAESYRQKQIAEQCRQTPSNERYLHIATNKRHLLLIDIGGACWLEDVERRVREVSRADLENSELWRRLP